MPSGTQPGSSSDYSILTPGNATLSAQEVKEDLPKPTDGRIMGSLRQTTLSRPADRELLEIALRKVELPD